MTALCPYIASWLRRVHAHRAGAGADLHLSEYIRGVYVFDTLTGIRNVQYSSERLSRELLLSKDTTRYSAAVYFID